MVNFLNIQMMNAKKNALAAIQAIRQMCKKASTKPSVTSNQPNLGVDKVTLAMIRAIGPGNTEVFKLPTLRACYNARSQVTYVRTMDGHPLKIHVNRNDNTVTITHTLFNPQKN